MSEAVNMMKDSFRPGASGQFFSSLRMIVIAVCVAAAVGVFASENASAQPTVEFTSAGQRVTEDIGRVSFGIRLSEPAGQNVIVPYSVGGTAEGNGVDHTLTDGVVTIPAGELSRAVEFTIVDDDLSENDETVIIAMGQPVNAVKGAVAVHTVTIVDNDAAAKPSVFWASESQTVNESAGTVVITAVLNAKPEKNVIVRYSVGGTATGGGVDHDLADGEFIIPAGSLFYNLAFKLIDDSIPEGDEIILVTMNSAVNAAIGAAVSHVVTIKDNDAYVLPAVSFASANQSVQENAGSASVVVAMSALSAQDIVIPYSVGGTAEGKGVDHDLESGTVAIPAGQSTAKLEFGIVDDKAAEGDKLIVITLGKPANAVLGTISVHTVTIRDNDAGVVPFISWKNAIQTVKENQGQVTVTAVLSTVSANDVTAPFKVSGTASGDGADHDLSDGAIVIPAGKTSASLTFNLTDDHLHEPEESIILTFGVVQNAVPGEITLHIINIIDDDLLPSAGWEATSKEFAENAGTVTVGVVLSGPAPADVIVPYQVGGTAATDGSDHDLADGEITVKSGETKGVLSFTINDDSIYEGNEVILLTIGEPKNAVKGAASVMAVTILDNDLDDVPPIITLIGDNPAAVKLGEDYKDAGASAADNTEGDITEKIHVQTTVNTKSEGTYQVIYSVSDESGNAAAPMVRVVHVTRFPDIYAAKTMKPSGIVSDQNMHPLDGVSVSSNAASFIARTDPEGAFTYAPLYQTGRTYYLTFSKPGYVPASRKYSGTESLDNVVLASVSNSLGFDIFSGTCLSVKGDPIRQAFISLDNAQYPSGALTDAEGRFRIAVNRKALPYSFTADKYAFVRQKISPLSPSVSLEILLVPETRIRIVLPDTTELYQTALKDNKVTVGIYANPAFAGKPFEIETSLSASVQPVFKDSAYTFIYHPYQNFSLKIEADTSEDYNVRNGYAARTEVGFAALSASAAVMSTAEIIPAAPGFPLIVRSSSVNSQTWAAIPVDGLQGEYVPEKVLLTLIEYDDPESVAVTGKIAEVRVTDEYGKPLGGFPENPDYPLKKLCITMEYPLLVSKEGLEDGSNQIRYGNSVKSLLEENSSVLALDRIADISAKTVTFWTDTPGAFGFDLTHRPPPQQKLNPGSDDSGPCFITTVGGIR